MLSRLSRRARGLVVLGVAVLLIVLATVVVSAVQARPDAAARAGEQVLRVPVGPEADGSTVALDVSVLTPEPGTAGADGEGRRAAVLLAHGFGGSKDDLEAQARDLAAEGYVVLTYTARGFGESGGLVHLDSPDYEVADASRLIDLLATRDDVLLDADGDPRVGIAGGSYGGALALLAAGTDERVDAIVPAITWNDLAASFFPQNASGQNASGQNASGQTASGDPAAAVGVFKQRWASLFFSGVLAASIGDAGSAQATDLGLVAPRAGSAPLVCGRFAPDVCGIFARAATDGRPSRRGLALLERSSPATVLDRITAPTLLVQGEQDSLFGLDQADANARGIAEAGTEVAVRWIDGGHDAGGADLSGDELTTPVLGWFDHHLRGGPDPGTSFDFALPAALLGDGRPPQLRAASYGGTEAVTVELEGDPRPVLSPAGGQPAALTSLPGAGALLGRAVSASGAAFGLAALPGQSAVFTSAPLSRALTVTGAPLVRLSVTSSSTEATMFASAWVVDADGVASLPRQLVSPLRLDSLRPGTPVEVDVTLPWSAYELQPGERLRVVVSSTDQSYAVPADQRLYRVGIADGQVVLPTIQATRLGGGALAPWPLVALVVLVLLLAAALAAWSARRRRREGVQARIAELETVPLVVEGLTKEYADGFRAVDDVGWRAEQGQVVGLLGPNGAGKTTTMRMLVGLIHADAGEVHVLGERVSPGSSVLGRVGALIEGPGFLPHLSGRANLQAWWAATGRPQEEAHLEEALVVADLGVAIDRPVRSYSQGMRQRLGIAQAMLGLPEVLLLDEPTNGLDPPQIRNLRHVLADYVAAGRTVVVSSHLLAEVEQTCSHVVVMHRGRVLLTGAVADLLAESATVLVGVEGDAGRAAAALRAVPGVEAITVEDDRLRIEGSPARSAVVATLVDGGFGVTSLDARRHLEEVFMGLVGDDSAAQRAPAEVR